MFVSSYNTYIPQKTTHKPQESTQENNEREFTTDGSKLFAKQLDKVVTSSVKIPLNYISNYKSLHNHQLLEQQSKSNKNYAQTKFSKINTMQSAQNAYSQNSQLFSLLPKPKIALADVIKLPKNLQQNSAFKSKIVNTYIENDNYYKITA
jgi:uncharacterized protein YcbK (DUF882 family)